MKKFLLAVTAIILFACNNDDDSAKVTINNSDDNNTITAPIQGSWKRVAFYNENTHTTTSVTDCETNEILNFKENSTLMTWKIPVYTDGSCVVDSRTGSYSYNGQTVTFSFPDGDLSFEVKEVTTETLKIKALLEDVNDSFIYHRQ